jgi:hypothetical protein
MPRGIRFFWGMRPTGAKVPISLFAVDAALKRRSFTMMVGAVLSLHARTWIDAGRSARATRDDARLL